MTLDDPDLGITDTDMTLESGTIPLQPGEELVYSYESTITGDLINTATVTGHPEGEGDPVTDSNDAEVQILAPGIALEKTVLAGADAECPGVEGDDELVTGEEGDPVTYCFRVTNTGDTHLFPVTIDDPDLGITDTDMTVVSGDPTVPLAPGGEIVWSYTTTITEDLVNTATTTGTPTDEDGDPTGNDDVEDDNDAEVEVEAIDVSVLTPTCENDTPYLVYEIDAMGFGDEATITFSGDGESYSVVVPVGSGQVLWPGAAVDADGNPTDWPGWDQDEDGEWFLNPDNPFIWARDDVQITVEVNPTFGPVTVTYPPPTPLCTANPPPPEPPPELPRTGTATGSQSLFGLTMLGLGLGLIGTAGYLTRRRDEP